MKSILGASPAERIEMFSIPEPNSGCVLWFGSIDRFGYGQTSINGKVRRATHLALELDGRPVPAGMCACHRCDNPGCINADHLFIGSQSDNLADMRAKNRHNFSGLRTNQGSPPILSGSQHHYGKRSHCHRGHPFSAENTIVRKSTKSGGSFRECKICKQDRRAS